MFNQSRRLVLVIVLVLLATLAAALWEPLQRAKAMAVLQREVGAGNRCGGWSDERGFGTDAFDWMDDHLRTNARYQVYRNGIKAIMQGPVDQVVIHIERGLHGDPGAALAGLPRLRAVYFQERSPAASAGLITEEEWSHQCARIRNLAGVEELLIRGTNLSDSSLAPLAGHPRVTKLMLGTNRITPQAFKTLASLPCLRELNLHSPAPYSTSSDLTEQQWASLCRESKTLPHLLSLTLIGWTLTDAAIAPLAGHPTLETLKLSHHSLTPACASTFNAMPHLKIVNLGSESPDFPQKTMDAIRAAAPKILIRH